MTAPRRVTPQATLVLPADAEHGEWLAARQKGIGSSDVADILGVGYKSARHVYYQKRGDLPLEGDEGEAATWGHLHEETVAREWARRNKSAVRRVGLVANVLRPWMLCTLDRQVPGGLCPLRGPEELAPRCCLEVKTRSAWKAGQWLREVPDDVHAQTLWQLMTTGYDHVHVACLIGGNDFRQFTVRRDEDLETRILSAVEVFRTALVNGVVPPMQEEVDPDRYIELEALLHPNREGTKRLNDRDALEVYDLLRDRHLSTQIASAHAERAKRSTARLVELLGDGDTAVVDEEVLYTYNEVNGQRRTDFAQLQERWPEAYAACVTQPKHRAISIKWKGEK